MSAKADDYEVTVCDACLCASCWHGEFLCEKSRNAGTKRMLASALRKLDLEHPSNYSREKIALVCGKSP